VVVCELLDAGPVVELLEGPVVALDETPTAPPCPPLLPVVLLVVVAELAFVPVVEELCVVGPGPAVEDPAVPPGVELEQAPSNTTPAKAPATNPRKRSTPRMRRRIHDETAVWVANR
jgi:hypothetical protein